MINREMFQRIHEQIAAHPEMHDQSNWESRAPVCGTTRCVAGWAIHFWATDQGMPSSLELFHMAVRHPVNATRFARSSGNLYQAAAADILGLTPRQATELFIDSGNEEAFDLVAHYANGELGWV